MAATDFLPNPWAGANIRTPNSVSLSSSNIELEEWKIAETRLVQEE
jgi:hypothetical protein